MRRLGFLTAMLLFSIGAQAQTISTQTVELRDAGNVDLGDVFVGRKDDEIRVRVFVDDGVLTSGNVYQLVVRLYNNPQWCDTPNQCDPAFDLPANGGSTLIEATQFVLTGGIAGTGPQQFFGRFYEGAAGPAAMPDLVQGNGLRAGATLDAQLDITVRDMGVAQSAADLLSQLNDITADGQCGAAITCANPLVSDLIVP